MADDAINNAAAETVENGQKEPSDDRGRDTTSPPVASTILLLSMSSGRREIGFRFLARVARDSALTPAAVVRSCTLSRDPDAGHGPMACGVHRGFRLFISGWILVPKSSTPCTKSSKVSSTPAVPGTSAISSIMRAMLS